MEISDIKLKTNITLIDDALMKVMSLRGVWFEWITPKVLRNNKRNMGFIAQEVELVVPELVGESEDRKTKGVYYNLITALLVEAVKELNLKITLNKNKNSIDSLMEKTSNDRLLTDLLSRVREIETKSNEAEVNRKDVDNLLKRVENIEQIVSGHMCDIDAISNRISDETTNVSNRIFNIQQCSIEKYNEITVLTDRIKQLKSDEISDLLKHKYSHEIIVLTDRIKQLESDEISDKYSHDIIDLNNRICSLTDRIKQLESDEISDKYSHDIINLNNRICSSTIELTDRIKQLESDEISDKYSHDIIDLNNRICSIKQLESDEICDK
jgi:hypothetical protein